MVQWIACLPYKSADPAVCVEFVCGMRGSFHSLSRSLKSLNFTFTFINHKAVKNIVVGRLAAS